MSKDIKHFFMQDIENFPVWGMFVAGAGLLLLTTLLIAYCRRKRQIQKPDYIRLADNRKFTDLTCAKLKELEKKMPTSSRGKLEAPLDLENPTSRTLNGAYLEILFPQIIQLIRSIGDAHAQSLWEEAIQPKQLITALENGTRKLSPYLPSSRITRKNYGTTSISASSSATSTNPQTHLLTAPPSSPGDSWKAINQLLEKKQSPFQQATCVTPFLLNTSFLKDAHSNLSNAELEHALNRTNQNASLLNKCLKKSVIALLCYAHNKEQLQTPQFDTNATKLLTIIVELNLKNRAINLLGWEKEIQQYIGKLLNQGIGPSEAELWVPESPPSKSEKSKANEEKKHIPTLFNQNIKPSKIKFSPPQPPPSKTLSSRSPSQDSLVLFQSD